MTKVLLLFLGMAISAANAQALHPDCLPGTTVNTKLVTHYMVPLLSSYNNQVCDVIEGTCIYNKGNVPYMHNYGYKDLPLSQQRCQNGYGNKLNCIHPCRVLAASMKYHRFGQIVFIPELVGQKCGNLKRDGFEMVHDGYMVVLDTGAASEFHEQGRFDFFWGRCHNMKGGVCLEGAEPISEALTKKPYCTVYDPSHPQANADVKAAFIQKVQAEDRERGDLGAAEDISKL